MTGEEREQDLLRYIQESIERIEQYTRGGRAVFLADPMIQDAVLRRLETLADAANRLSPALKARHAHIPWRAIYGFRNIAAHTYLAVNLERVWQTVVLHLPSLQVVVLHELPPPSSDA